MRQALTVALAQYTPASNIEENLEIIRGFAADCSAGQADWLLLPEYASCLDGRRAIMAESARGAEAFMSGICQIAREHKLWIFVGSHAAPAGSGKMVNRSVVVDASGRVRATYDKLHMFDVALADGKIIHESKHYESGDEAALVTTPWGKVGLSVCYDVRFPQLYRTLSQAGAEILLVPAAFMRQTGVRHWNTLLQARAIENRAFVLAAATCGESGGSRSSYGYSLVVDPDGTILGSLEDAPGLLIQSISLCDVEKLRAQLPSLSHDRPFSLTHHVAPEEHLS